MIKFVHFPDSKVYRPKDDRKWELAKAQVQLTDLIVTQVYYHLLRTHFRMEPLCVGMNRHLSKYHPMHQILKFHCRALLPVNSNGVSALFDEHRFLHILSSIGHTGSIEMFNRGYEQMIWGDNDFTSDIEVRYIHVCNLLSCAYSRVQGF